jgi:altronate dehydratase small subunit
MINAFLMDSIDTVVTVTSPIFAGEEVTFLLEGKERTIKARTNIPIYHKVAIKTAKTGDIVLKYGEEIGFAIDDFNIGDHVHTHNLSSILSSKKEK